MQTKKTSIVEWRSVAGYEGQYSISNTGKVLSEERTVNSKGGSIRLLPAIIMKGFNDSDGYRCVTLMKNGKRKGFTIHRLVALAFIPNPNNLPQVNHKDGNKQNNCVDNLEWCTALQNNQHAIKTGLIKLNGQDNPFFGKQHSEETISSLISKNPTSKKVIDTNTGISYPSIKAAATANGITRVSLNARLTRYKTEKRFQLLSNKSNNGNGN